MFENKHETVAAVVVTYNRKELLRQCLDGILAQTRPVDAIYVVDNASTDGTDQIIATEYADRVMYERLPQNTGSAGGFHHGMKRAYEDGHDWIWVMDDDAAPHSAALACLLEIKKTWPRPPVAAVCAQFAPGGMALATSYIYNSQSRRLEPIDPSKLPGPARVDVAPFVGLLVSRDAIARVGLPMAQLYLWGDDGEFCWRLREIGDIVLVPTARIEHPGRPERLPVTEYWKVYYGLRNRIYLRHRVEPRSAAALLAMAGRMVLGICRHDREKVLRIRVVLQAVLDGFRGRLGPGPQWLCRRREDAR